MINKNISYLFTLFIISVILVSCGSDDEITYPVTYSYDRVEFDDFLLFKVIDGGFEGIDFTERLSAIEPIVREEVLLSAEENEIGFNQVTLLSEDQMLFLNTDQPTDSFFINYTQLSSTLFRADLSGNGTEPFELMLTDNNNELRYCIESSVFFRQTPNGSISPGLDFDFCDFSQFRAGALDDIRINENLVINDTVFYNQANYIMTKD